MTARPSFQVHVIHCEDMNPDNKMSAKGKPWKLYKVHCVVDMGDGGKRVCQLVNDSMVGPGVHQVPITIGERDGRAVFIPEGFVPVVVDAKRAA